MFGIMNHLNIVLCEDADDAQNKVYIYVDGTYKAVEIDTVVVIKNGTETGKPTVDIILKDQEGNKMVVMVTGALLKSIPCGS